MTVSDKVQQDVALAELELDDARIQQWDVEGILAFAEHLIGNLAGIWLEANLAQKRAIQDAVFPQGIPFDGRGIGTAVTCLFFNKMQLSAGHENDLASPKGTDGNGTDPFAVVLALRIAA